MSGRRHAAVVSLMSAATLFAGVSFFAWRTAHEFIGDGEVSSIGVLLSGVVLLVLPVARYAYWAMLRSRRALAPVCLVSVASGIVVAISFRPGNMYLIGFFIVLALAVPGIMIAGLVAARFDTGPHP